MCWSSKVLARLEEDVSGGVVLQKSVPWGRGDKMSCIKRAGANGRRDDEVKGVARESEED